MKFKNYIILPIVVLMLTGCGHGDYFSAIPVAEAAEASSGEETPEPVAPSSMYVQVSGSVKYPGVYEVPEGTRLYEVVEKAGGFTDDAASDEINQVEVLSDGQLIKIPSRQELLEQQQEESGLININTADEALLSTLPGIGESKARQIVSYRETNGSFQNKEDIMNVPGIKEGTYANFEALIEAR